MAVLALKLVVGYWTLSTSGSLWHAAVGSVHVLITSVAVGAVLGVVRPALLRSRQTSEGGLAVAFGLAVVLLTALSYGLMFSPLLAALSFGVVARERRVYLTNAQRNFGTAGDALTLFLFVYIASLMTWPSVLASLAAGLLLIVVRTVVKVGVSVALAKVSGITVRKGVWTGLALTPMSAYAILLLEQSREQGFSPAPEIMAAMAGMMLVQELLGPVVTQRTLMAARETS
jgi:NhaP-type Na+/H+ or K+/H+ antiporter